MPGIPLFVDDYNIPGMESEVFTFENEFLLAGYPSYYNRSAVLLGASTDSGNTGNTSFLRKGLLLSLDRSTNIYAPWTPYTPNATTNNLRQSIDGILPISLDMSSAEDRVVPVLTMGRVMTDRLIVPTTSTVGLSSNAYRYLVGRQLGGGIEFDSPQYGLHQNLVYVNDDTEGAFDLEDYPNGTHFIVSGANAVALTLPAPLPGLQYTFSTFGAADIVLTGATAGDIVGPGDAALDTATLSDIGDSLTLLGITTADTPTHKWLAIPSPVAASSSVAFA